MKTLAPRYSATELWRLVRARLPSPQGGKRSRACAKLAEELGVSRARVANLARLTTLPSVVQDMLSRGTLKPGHAEALLKLPTAAAQEAAARDLGLKRKTVRELRLAVLGGTSARKGAGVSVPEPSTDPDVARVEQELGNIFGTEARIAYGRDGSGWAMLHFTDLDTLDGLLERLGYRG